jgi:hypothetical protein
MEVINDKKLYKLAFCGKMGSGKTTATLVALGALTEKYGAELAIGYVIKFAQPLYQSMLAFHRMVKGKPERVFLQRLGDLGKREFGEDVFERIFEDNIQGLITNRLPQLKQEHILVMTDDLRFPNEYNCLKKLNFTVIGIETETDIRQKRIAEAYTDPEHNSETSLQLFEPDFSFANNFDTVDLFEAALQQLLQDNDLI